MYWMSWFERGERRCRCRCLRNVANEEHEQCSLYTEHTEYCMEYDSNLFIVENAYQRRNVFQPICTWAEMLLDSLFLSFVTHGYKKILRRKRKNMNRGRENVLECWKEHVLDNVTERPAEMYWKCLPPPCVMCSSSYSYIGWTHNCSHAYNQSNWMRNSNAYTYTRHIEVNSYLISTRDVVKSVISLIPSINSKARYWCYDTIFIRKQMFAFSTATAQHFAIFIIKYSKIPKLFFWSHSFPLRCDRTNAWTIGFCQLIIAFWCVVQNTLLALNYA